MFAVSARASGRLGVTDLVDPSMDFGANPDHYRMRPGAATALAAGDLSDHPRALATSLFIKIDSNGSPRPTREGAEEGVHSTRRSASGPTLWRTRAHRPSHALSIDPRSRAPRAVRFRGEKTRLRCSDEGHGRADPTRRHGPAETAGRQVLAHRCRGKWHDGWCGAPSAAGRVSACQGDGDPVVVEAVVLLVAERIRDGAAGV
jgi:hypothetical protein